MISKMASIIIALSIFQSISFADTITLEPDQRSYNYVSHYEVDIDAPATKVWPNLIDLKSWMYEFEMAPQQETSGNVGDVFRLYPEMDFKVQIIQKTTNELLVISNLPSVFGGESSTGIAVINLTENNDTTHLDLVMSRRYTPEASSENSMWSKRQSTEFQESTRIMWQDKFLARLKSLSEESNQQP